MKWSLEKSFKVGKGRKLLEDTFPLYCYIRCRLFRNWQFVLIHTVLPCPFRVGSTTLWKWLLLCVEKSVKFVLVLHSFDGDSWFFEHLPSSKWTSIRKNRLHTVDCRWLKIATELALASIVHTYFRLIEALQIHLRKTLIPPNTFILHLHVCERFPFIA